MYVRHVLVGGFAADDWVDGAHFTFHGGHGFWAAVRAHQHLGRSVWAFINTVDFTVMGLHTVPHLAQTAAVSVAAACLILLVARRLGVPVPVATAVAIVVLVWPFDDSTRLWANGAQMAIALTLVLAGFMVALSGLERRGRAAVAWHVTAAALYFASVLDYELVAPLALLCGVAYVWRFGWRRARLAWLADWIAVLSAASVSYGSNLLLHTKTQILGFTAGLHHGATIGSQALTLLAQTLEPFGAIPRWIPLLGAGVVVMVGVVVGFTGPLEGQRATRRPLALLCVGVVVIVAGYIMIVWANSGYVPSGMGVSNRINAAAAPGYAAVAVALIWIAYEIIVRALRSPFTARIAGAACLSFVIIGAAVHVQTDAANWDHAWAEQKTILSTLQRLVPDPPPGTTVFTFGRPGYAAPAVPIFGGGGNNDMLGAVQLLWHTSSVRGFPVLDQMRFECGPTSVSLLATGADSRTTYGHALFVDLRAHRVRIPRTRAACVADTITELPYAAVNEHN